MIWKTHCVVVVVIVAFYTENIPGSNIGLCQRIWTKSNQGHFHGSGPGLSPESDQVSNQIFISGSNLVFGFGSYQKNDQGKVRSLPVLLL